jgi:NADH-quinone oxidoreductase subunit J
VLRATNAVHGVLALVVVFALTALLFLLLGAEFFALLIFTVYIGAIAILFLFVIMMLDLRLAELHGSLYYHVPLGASVGFVFLGILYSLLAPDIFTVAWSSLTPDLWLVAPQSNLKVLGQALYNYYVLYVVLVTLLLLLAMVGAIALTLDDSRARRPEASPEMPRSD